ncbi:MAG: sigma 54-interacting transcriptional regulator [Magnetococcales bacterium]|nr:sigma 54-interacting transcriptional regulator [Magnetococcales bacterium]
MDHSILVVDDEQNIRTVLKLFLTRAGYHVETADSYHSALGILTRTQFDLIFTDIHLGDMSGVDLLKEIRKRGDNTLVLLITGYPNMETVQQALRHGAYDYLTKPILKETLLRLTDNAMRHKRLNDENEHFRRNMAAIFRSVRDAIITVDRTMQILSANDAAESICDLVPNARNMHLVDALPYCGLHYQEIISRVIDEKQDVAIDSLNWETESGMTRTHQVRATPLLDEQGAMMGAVVVIRDNTRLAALEKDLKARRGFHRIIGDSTAMQGLYGLLEDLCRVDSTVLVIGESGTGKELVAEAIHHQGIRRDGPLVKINCAALPETLLESELFGHIRGAFTGAVRDKVGRFKLADGGTIFLDEIGDISPRMQTRLLRVLQEREFEPVGSNDTIAIDTRVVAATNRDLRKRVAEGKFREDLFYRLRVVEVNIPPLRERMSDIPLLLKHFIERFNARFNKALDSCTAAVIKRFMEHEWPGNVRELEHVVEHAFVVCHEKIIDIPDLPSEFRTAPRPKTEKQPHAKTYPLEEIVRNRENPIANQTPETQTESERILMALDKTGWIKSRAARMLGFSRSTLYRKMKALNIPETGMPNPE